MFFAFFVRSYAAKFDYLDNNVQPDKQFKKNKNKPLSDFVSSYTCNSIRSHSRECSKSTEKLIYYVCINTHIHVLVVFKWHVSAYDKLLSRVFPDGGRKTKKKINTIQNRDRMLN